MLEIIKKQERLFLLTSIFLIGAFFLPSVKMFFIWSTLYVVALFLKLKSWEKVILFAYWPLTIYYVGQLYSFQLIRYEEMYHPLYPEGRSLYFKLTPLLLLSLSMGIYWTLKCIKEKVWGNWLITVLILGVISGLVSSFYRGAILPKWIEVGKALNNLIPILWLWWAGSYINKANKSEKQFFWNYLNKFFKLMLISVSILVLVQVFKGSVLGLVVEQRSNLPYDDGMGLPGIKRVVGIWTHANEAAFYIFCWLMAWIILEIKKVKKYQKIFQEWLILPMIALALLQSRAVFLGVAMVLMGGIILNWREFKIQKYTTLKIREFKAKQLLLVLACLFSILLVGSRFIWVMLNSGTWENNWQTRGKLIGVAKELVRNNLWWGVGEGNFIPVAFREDKSGTMKSYPESVHNGWWLILAENGLIGMIVWITFLIVLMGQWYMRLKKNMKYFYWLGLIILSQSLIMIFQPFSKILMANLMMLVLLLANEDERLV